VEGEASVGEAFQRSTSRVTIVHRSLRCVLN